MSFNDALDRRQFIALGGAAAAAASLGPAATASAATGPRLVPRDRIGIQLFTLRTTAERDLPGTLKYLSDLGYRNLEVAGLFGRSPAEFRKLVDDNGLRVIAGHQLVGPSLVAFFGAREVEDALDEAQTLGQPWVGTAGITIPQGIVEGGEPQTADRYRQLAELANQWGQSAADRGMRAYIHMHYWEFWRDLGTGESFAEILFDRTDKNLVWFEPDLFWMAWDDVDPLDWLPKYQDRFMGFHVKDGNPDQSGGYFKPGFTDLGRGSINFRRIFRAIENRNRPYFIVERDDQPHPRETARVAYRYLRRLR
jgi:sugar phosphate isomerase/epimerase